MNPVAEVLVLFDSGDDVRVEVTRKRSSEFNTRHSRRGDGAQQTAERRRAFEIFEAVFDARPVAVNVLPDQVNLFVTQRLQVPHFRDDLAGGAAALAATRIRYDAKRTKLIAAFDDRNESDVRRVSLGRRN